MLPPFAIKFCLEEKTKMKKTIALLLALVMVFALCACGQTNAPAVEESKAPEADATEAPAAENQHFDKLTLEFVPSKDADVIIAGTKNLPELVQAEMSKLGYDIDEVDITVGTSYDATGEAMSAGSIDLGWLPGGTYALYSDDVDVILTATRNGLSNDSTNPADWNGEANATQKNGPQVTYYRSLIYATPSEYGKELAAKVNAGEKLTWEDLDKAKWAVQKTSSSAGYIYPSMWLMATTTARRSLTSPTLSPSTPATAPLSPTLQLSRLTSSSATPTAATTTKPAGCSRPISRMRPVSRAWAAVSPSGTS